ncbi:hypothetical protein GOODEAATRI_031990 [Goodea atripinnis]|uniref:ATP synthase F0 subunit 8 n=1 Tax=Goodea atripinnis TaxID=208336 RepID=A0ABV0NFD5_9TELE
MLYWSVLILIWTVFWEKIFVLRSLKVKQQRSYRRTTSRLEVHSGNTTADAWHKSQDSMKLSSERRTFWVTQSKFSFPESSGCKSSLRSFHQHNFFLKGKVTSSHHPSPTRLTPASINTPQNQ